ncbi:hypothetical protein IC607_00240 [Cellulomonas sp. JH27-2]|uniref:hypothetical protein n=1 Tax=Cellulomonas sp. JH27-2 TaxID=2774139 RepID=UPI001784595B|nr:hypothetical protein [Cellulomonas sp. JH27-2]MBD8057400.1 hypothetical protein [Cellulomonas sp. JH27-2]
MTIPTTSVDDTDLVPVPLRRSLRLLPGDGAAVHAARPLVRELEDLTDAMHERGATARLRSDLVDLLGCWAQALVGLHRSSVTMLTPVGELPWVLADGLPAWLDELPREAGPVWAVRAHPAIRRALDDTRRAWSAVQLTHGDPTGDAVDVTRSAAEVEARLTPTGSARAGVLGDPRWDVATVVDWLACALDPALDPVWGIDPAATFVARYRAHGGDALPSRAMAAARTLTTAVEWTAQLAVLQEPDEEELAWLAGLWGRPLSLVAPGG